MSISVNASAPAAAGQTQQSSATAGPEMEAAYRAESQKMIDRRGERDDRDGRDSDQAREHSAKPRKKKIGTGMVNTVGPMFTYHLREQTVLLKLGAKANAEQVGRVRGAQVGQTAGAKSGPQALEGRLGEERVPGKAKPVEVRETAVGLKPGELKVGRPQGESPASLSAFSAVLHAPQPESSVAPQVVSQVAPAFASVAETSSATASKKEQQHSNAEAGADTRNTTALSAHTQQATIGTRAASSEAAPQARRPPQPAAGEALGSSADVKGTSVRYSFKTWAGQPAVDVRLDAQQAAQIVTAHASSDGVRDAMQRHSNLLSSDVTLRFERHQADDDRDQTRRQRQQQQEADEQ